MKTKWKYILIIATILCVLAIILAASFHFIIQEFMSDGVHVIGKYAHVELQKNCYFINTETKEVIEESTFTVSGYLFDRHYSPFKQTHNSSLFDGYMNIDKYNISLKDGFQKYVGAISTGTPFINITYAPLNLDKSSYYTVFISISDPEVIVIQFPFSDEHIVAVCGENKQDALQNYETFWDILGE